MYYDLISVKIACVPEIGILTNYRVYNRHLREREGR